MADKISQLPAAAALDGSEELPLVQGGATVQTPNGALFAPDFISGFKMVWGSANSLSVTSGAAYILSLGRVVRSNGTLTLNGLALGNSTWYHLYLYLNAGVPAVECVKTAPDAPYYGTARMKTGDASRRYIGSVLTNSSGALINFLHSGNEIDYIDKVLGGGTIYRVLSAGTATTPTLLSASAIVPITSRLAKGRFQNTDATYSVFFASADYAMAVGVDGQLSVSIGGIVFLNFPLSASQQLQYEYQSTPGTGFGNGAYVDILGYIYER